jgi:hypothetical protein
VAGCQGGCAEVLALRCQLYVKTYNNYMIVCRLGWQSTGGCIVLAFHVRALKTLSKVAPPSCEYYLPHQPASAYRYFPLTVCFPNSFPTLVLTPSLNAPTQKPGLVSVEKGEEAAQAAQHGATNGSVGEHISVSRCPDTSPLLHLINIQRECATRQGDGEVSVTCAPGPGLSLMWPS